MQILSVFMDFFVQFQVPLMITPGNRETEPQGSMPNKLIHAAYNARYPMPQDPERIQTQAHQGYYNPNDSGLGVNTPATRQTLRAMYTMLELL